MKRKQKVRGQINRTETRFVLIGVEGERNKTERQYFSELIKGNNSFKLFFAKGNATDPKGIVEEVTNSINDYDIDLSGGDLAFAVMDSDANPLKQIKIWDAVSEAKKNGVEVIISTPVFEIWFLNHFLKSPSTKYYGGYDDVKKDLIKYIPDYEKNNRVFHLLKDKTIQAVNNAKLLAKYHYRLGRDEYSVESNPSTSVYKIIEKIK